MNYLDTYITNLHYYCKNLCEAVALRQERSPRRGARRVGAINSLQSLKKNFQERPSVQIQYNCVSIYMIDLFLEFS